MEKSLSAVVSKSLESAAALIESKRRSAALAQLQSVQNTLIENQVEAASPWSVLLRLLGDFYKGSSEYLKALKYYQEALQRDSSDNVNTAEIHFGIGSTLCLIKHYEAAVEYLFYAFQYYSSNFAFKKRATLTLGDLYYFLALAHEHTHKREAAYSFYCRGYDFAVQHIKSGPVVSQLRSGVHRLNSSVTRILTPAKSRSYSKSLLNPELLKHCREKEREVIRVYLGNIKPQPPRGRLPIKDSHKESTKIIKARPVALARERPFQRNLSVSVLPQYRSLSRQHSEVSPGKLSQQKLYPVKVLKPNESGRKLPSPGKSVRVREKPRSAAKLLPPPSLPTPPSLHKDSPQSNSSRQYLTVPLRSTTKLERKAGPCGIQAAIRGNLIRKHYKFLSAKAVKIQSWIRMKQVNMLYKDIREAAILIQKAYRGNQQSAPQPPKKNCVIF